MKENLKYLYISVTGFVAFSHLCLAIAQEIQKYLFDGDPNILEALILGILFIPLLLLSIVAFGFVLAIEQFWPSLSLGSQKEFRTIFSYAVFWAVLAILPWATRFIQPTLVHILALFKYRRIPDSLRIGRGYPRSNAEKQKEARRTKLAREIEEMTAENRRTEERIRERKKR